MNEPHHPNLTTDPVRDTSTDDLLRRAFEDAGDAGPTDDCLDAEAFAAWLDKGLDADGRAKAEVHLADCGHCRSILAALVTTELNAADRTTRTAHAWTGRARWLPPLVAAAAIVIIVLTMPREGVVPSDAASEQEQRLAQAGNEEAFADRQDARELDRTAPARSRAEVGSVAADELVAEADADTVAAASPRWRLVGGRLERLADDGATWQVAARGIETGLTAFASPSPTSCWVVGRAGAVLLTTDGATWQRLVFPEATDLSAVTAEDGRIATVTTADGRRFTTRDAGRTWTGPGGPVQVF